MNTILINAILCLTGLAGLYYGGEKLVTGAVRTANHLQIKPQLIAITIVALGTSFPELVVSLNAVLSKSQGIAWGNVVGSNISNLLCVLGIAAIVTPLSFLSKSFKVDVFWLVLATGILTSSILIFSAISVLGGALLIFLLIIIVSHLTLNVLKKSDKPVESAAVNFWIKAENWIGLITILFGAILLIGSAELVVYTARNIAETLKVPEAFIGLTIIALGTSLPEVAASIVAVRKGHADIAIGNVIGSNIFNSLGIIGAAAIVSGSNKFIAPANFTKFDVPVMFLATVVLSFIFLLRKKIGRNLGFFFIFCYLIYVFVTFQQN